MARVLFFSLMMPSGPAGAPPEIVAHRGASDEAPENTLAAFRLGWEQAVACECDVTLTKDGKLAVIHDATTKRTAGLDRRVAEQMLEELKSLDAGSWKGAKWAGEKIPALPEVLEIMPEGKRLFIEVKGGPEALPELERVLGAFPGKAPRVVIIGFGYDTMVQARKRFPKVAVFWISGSKADKKTGQALDLDGLIAKARAGGLDGLDLEKGFPIDAAFVAKVRAAGLKLYTWTVDDAATARAEAAAGVDGITTNRPQGLRRELSSPR
jgi:glycerophosphoryl diester phosphodiesterase